MARNILIFSDGTGQVGGYEFDEDRTNVYKLYRATRVLRREFNSANSTRSRARFALTPLLAVFPKVRVG
jgi:hypothetical protein